jgi:hypothetical protein
LWTWTETDLSDYSGFDGVGATYTAEYPDQVTGSDFPEFSWDTVPRWLVVRSRDPLSNDQVSSIATNYQIVMLEKGNLQGHETTEAGVLDVAGRIKAVNPSIKTLFYWNARIHYGNYAANVEYEPNAWEWSTLEVKGGVTNIYLFKDLYCWYDFSAAGMRDWWVKTALGMVTNEVIDGVFIDAIMKTPSEAEGALYTNGVPATDYMLMADALAQSMPRNKLLIANALRNEAPNGQRTHMTYLDGSYLERWDVPMNGTSQSDADAIAVSIQLMREALLKGKIINLKSSPPDGYDSTQEHIAAHVDFPLAVFLIVAETNAYFSYQGGVDGLDPSWLWDTSWLEEFNRPLGPPLGAPVRDGYVYARSYQYVDVWVDISTRQTQFTWRDSPMDAAIIAWDNFDGGSKFLSRVNSSPINHAATATWDIVNRNTVLRDSIVDTSVSNTPHVALDTGDLSGFVESTKTDNFFGMYRAGTGGARTLTYSFGMAGCTNLNLAMDWAVSGDLADRDISVLYSIDGGATSEIFRVASSGINYNETFESGAVVDQNRSARSMVNGVDTGPMGRAFTTYTPTIAGTGDVLTVVFRMGSGVGGANGFGVDNLKLYGSVLEKNGYETWISGYGLSGTNAVATANPDGDAYNNLEEYIAGLNPNVFDTFAISNFTVGASNTFEWNSASNRVYNVYWSSNLLNGFTLIGNNAPDGMFSDTNHVGAPAGFYRITVGLE